MTPQEAFWNSWFGISLLGMTAAALLLAVGLAVGLASLYASRRRATRRGASNGDAAG